MTDRLEAEGADHPAGSLYAATANPHPRRPRLDGAHRTDVCVIGGGYCGLSAALHLAERGFEVVLLEANKLGWGASGRNGGQVHSGQRRGVEWLEDHVGKDAAKTLWQFGEDAKALIQHLIAKHDIACDYHPGLISGAHKARYVPEYRDHVAHMRETYGYEKVRFLERDDIRSLVKTEDFHGGSYDEGAGHLHPLNFALGIANAAEKAGAKLFEASRVVQITEGAKAKVTTENGEITADFVVVAGNGYLDRILPEVEARVMPINNFILATEPLGDRVAEVIPGREAVADSRFVINYFRVSADDRLVFGGGETYSPNFPADIGAFVRPYMLKLFPQIDDVAIDYAWGGTLAITMQRMPHVKRVSPNIYAACGFSGQGVTIAPLAGQIVAEAIAGQAERFDVYARLPTPQFPGGTSLRYPMLVLAMTWFALRDRL